MNGVSTAPFIALSIVMLSPIEPLSDGGHWRLYNMYHKDITCPSCVLLFPQGKGPSVELQGMMSFEISIFQPWSNQLIPFFHIIRIKLDEYFIWYIYICYIWQHCVAFQILQSMNVKQGVCIDIKLMLNLWRLAWIGHGLAVSIVTSKNDTSACTYSILLLWFLF